MTKYRYNYIIIGARGFYEVAYKDIMDIYNVNYFPSYKIGLDNYIDKFLSKLTFSYKVNKILKNPFKSYTYKKIYKHTFYNKDNLCFVLFSCNHQIINSSYLDYLKQTFHNAKLVLFWHDIVKVNKYLNISYLKDKFDLILSYDYNDAKKYGFEYYPTPYSNYTIEDDQNIPFSDIYFAGYAKTRYKKILSIYEQCMNEGLKCDFYLFRMPSYERLYADNIKYDQPLSYIENLKHIKRTKCLLEIIQEGAIGFTPRVWESIMYDKHLLTDNLFVKKSIFYNKNNMHIIKKTNLSDLLSKKVIYSSVQKEKLSPIHFIQFIDKKLKF